MTLIINNKEIENVLNMEDTMAALEPSNAVAVKASRFALATRFLFFAL